MIKKGIYEHYKGKKYEVIDICLHTETLEKLVLYKALYDCKDLEKEFGVRPYFVRPLNMFVEKIKIGNKKVKRFKLIK